MNNYVEDDKMAKTTKKKAPKCKTIGINVKSEFADEIEKRASSMFFSTSKYCKVILMNWLDSDEKLMLEED